MRIKICGLTESSNIQEVLEHQPDYIGFIFAEKSKRKIKSVPSIETNFTKRVGVFVNHDFKMILEKTNEYKLDVIQLHGNETPSIAANLKEKGLEVWKAFPVDSSFDFSQTKPFEQVCDKFVFDAKGISEGGNGITFDWGVLDKYQGLTPFLLAGGLGVSNISEALRISHPGIIGLDLNSKLEDEAGLKNINEVKNSINIIRNAV